MDPADIAATYPRLYHMAEKGSWASIEEHGLLSTSSLLDLFDVKNPQRSEILHRRRPKSVRLKHSVHREVVVRDQIPLSESRLEACLNDMTLEEWLGALNSRVFFWLDEAHLETLLDARAYRDTSHDVITVDTAALLERHGADITLSPINSGATMYKPRERGSRTFLPVSDYPFEARRRVRGRQNAIVELAVNGGVRDILEVALRVERRQAGSGGATTIWAKSDDPFP
jgi:hypothetical protein